jgi:hypothetical protein
MFSRRSGAIVVSREYSLVHGRHVVRVGWSFVCGRELDFLFQYSPILLRADSVSVVNETSCGFEGM